MTGIAMAQGMLASHAARRPSPLPPIRITAASWYGGVAADVTYFEPFRFALDAAYGSVDMGTSKLQRTRTST